MQTTSSITDNAWRQSEDYFNRIELQLQQRHEEILARRAALMSGREAFFNTNSGLPEVFIGSNAQARKRNDALFQTLQSIRHDLQSAAREDQQKISALKKAYLQSVQESMVGWIDQLREFKLRQVERIGEDRWNSDEDYAAIDAIIYYRPSSAATAAAADDEEAPVTASIARSLQAGSSTPRSLGGAAATPGTRQLAASVPDLSASHRSATSAASAPAAAAGGAGDEGRRRRGSGGSRLGAFLSSSWSNLRARMSRGGSRGAVAGANGEGAAPATRRQQR